MLSIDHCIMTLWGFSGDSVVKNLPANAGNTRDAGLIPGSGRSPGGGNGTHYSILAWKISELDWL